MKKIAFPFATIAAVALALSTAGIASADESSYFAALTDYGYGDTTQEVALNVGNGICEDVNGGVSRDATIQAIYDDTNDQVDAKDAVFLYDAALGHLC